MMVRRFLILAGVLFVATCGWVIVAARALPLGDEPGDDESYPAHGETRTTVDRLLFGVDYRVGVVRRSTSRKAD